MGFIEINPRYGGGASPGIAPRVQRRKYLAKDVLAISHHLQTGYFAELTVLRFNQDVFGYLAGRSSGSLEASRRAPRHRKIADIKMSCSLKRTVRLVGVLVSVSNQGDLRIVRSADGPQHLVRSGVRESTSAAIANYFRDQFLSVLYTNPAIRLGLVETRIGDQATDIKRGQ